MSDTTPATDDRSWLHATLDELLGEPTADIDETDDLRDHGLDSIRMFELVQRLQAVAPNIEFADVVDEPSIGGLARLLSRAGERAPTPLPGAPRG